MAEDYRRIADRIAADIASGRLEPGRRLPPQRVFARRRGIAGSTAGRVYGELVRRGLVVGEVGRGTFVRASPLPSGRALAEPATTAPVNLELNYPSAPGQSELLAAGLAPLLRPDVLAEATRTASAAGTRAAREAAAGLLATEGWRPAPDRLLFAGNARQAIAGALASLVPPGGRLGVESLTYPLVREITARLGVEPVPLPMDEQGLCARRAGRRPPFGAARGRVRPADAPQSDIGDHAGGPAARTGRHREGLGAAGRRGPHLVVPPGGRRPAGRVRPRAHVRRRRTVQAGRAGAHGRVPRGAGGPGRAGGGGGAGRGRGRRGAAVGRVDGGAVRAGGGGAVERGRDGRPAGRREAGGRGRAAAAGRRAPCRVHRSGRSAGVLRLVGAARAVAGGHVRGGGGTAGDRGDTGARLRGRPGCGGRRQARARVGSAARTGAGAADARRRRVYTPVSQAARATVRPRASSSQQTVRSVSVRAS
ncbi:putative GntR-family transcriptional regulator [Streptomyces avermitilis MA-4680 = NBRC 14893]|uniref:GntR-family transcriptional regulator n=1 Tax=Streptomyces avermitilis (strain ATCC 31267 / DSM 46492 / JCM 5070 / NBRC 14893 / NCIMB 12804 / NRRL 8165 / MA-4680) TaxID=227882 RepID=Q82F52_STRAW|nr:putative GntR-family transcriptional regulator [Streptomyces avermitilis MA-4680 = NBRC 14893]